MKLLNKIEENFCGTALLATTLIIFVNVIMRYFLGHSITWAEESVRYLMIWIAFIGGSICFRKGVHVSIDFFLEIAPRKFQVYIVATVTVISMVFTGIMSYYGVKLVMFIMKSGQVTPALSLPMWIPYLAIPIGFVLMSMRNLIIFISILQGKHEINLNPLDKNLDVSGVM
jgi:C4-dicarboxylate transporter DctQ subunit